MAAFRHGIIFRSKTRRVCERGCIPVFLCGCACHPLNEIYRIPGNVYVFPRQSAGIDVCMKISIRFYLLVFFRVHGAVCLKGRIRHRFNERYVGRPSRVAFRLYRCPNL